MPVTMNLSYSPLKDKKKTNNPKFFTRQMAVILASGLCSGDINSNHHDMRNTDAMGLRPLPSFTAAKGPPYRAPPPVFETPFALRTLLVPR